MDLRSHSPPARLDHIDRLPAEILSAVFILVYRDMRRLLSSARWLQLMLVCARWRSIIVNTAELWSHPQFHQLTTPVALELHMRRSQGAPLRVHMSSKHPLLSTILPWLLAQRARIQDLAIMDTYDSANAHYQDLLSDDFPTLATLTLNASLDAPNSTMFPASPAPKFPKLTAMALVRWELASGFDVSRLRSLVLCECNLVAWAGHSLDRFLDMLAACTALEYMDFSSCTFAPELFASHRPVSPSRFVTLPLLVGLMFMGAPRECATFLAHVHAPHAVNVVLGTGYSDSPDAVRDYADLLPPDRGVLPILARCTEIHVNDGYCKGGTDGGGTFEVRIPSADVTCGLRACATLFRSSPVVHLWLVAGAHQDANLGAFAAFPLLETVYVRGYDIEADAAAGVFVALSAEGVCPRLKEIEMEGCEPSVGLLEAVERCVRVRHERGARLGTVRLQLLHVIAPRCGPRPRRTRPGDGDGAGAGEGMGGVPEEEARVQGCETQREYYVRINLGRPEEIEYWGSEFVAGLQPFVDEIEYEPENLSDF